MAIFYGFHGLINNHETFPGKNLTALDTSLHEIYQIWPTESICLQTVTVLYTAKCSRGKTFAVFHSIVNVFPLISYGLVDWQCKSTSMLLQKFSREWQFCTLTVKVFPLESFAVYGI